MLSIGTYYNGNKLETIKNTCCKLDEKARESSCGQLTVRPLVRRVCNFPPKLLVQNANVSNPNINTFTENFCFQFINCVIYTSSVSLFLVLSFKFLLRFLTKFDAIKTGIDVESLV